MSNVFVQLRIAAKQVKTQNDVSIVPVAICRRGHVLNHLNLVFKVLQNSQSIPVSVIYLSN
jgi:hypothetical protein